MPDTKIRQAVLTGNPCSLIFCLLDERGGALAKEDVVSMTWTLSRERETVVDELEDVVYDVGDLADSQAGEVDHLGNSIPTGSAKAQIDIDPEHNYIFNDDADTEWRFLTIKPVVDSSVYGSNTDFTLYARYPLERVPQGNPVP